MATREILQRPLDAAGNAVTGLPASVNASDAVRRDEMLAGDAAVAAAIPALSSATPAAADAAAGAAGAATTAARGDHKHAVTVATPVATGTANADGASTALARADHVHQTSFDGVAAALATATADVAFNTHKLTGLADGVAGTDGATVQQVQAAIVASRPKPGDFWVACIDYDAGNDSSGVIGVSTTAATAVTAAGAAPFKTLEKIGQVFPKNGFGARALILIKPRASSATYRNIANSADQDGSWLNGFSGWLSILVRGSGDFSNSAADKIRCGFAQVSGTSIYNAIAGSSPSLLVCQLNGGGSPGLPAESSGASAISGYRIRFTSGALADQARNIWQVTGTNLVPGQDFGGTPGVTDQFVIEGAGVVVGDLTFNAGKNGSFDLVGIKALNNSTTSFDSRTTRIAGCDFQANLTLIDAIRYLIANSYVDETDATVVVGYGVRVVGTPTVSGCDSLSMSASTWLQNRLTISATCLTQFYGSACLGVSGVSQADTAGPGGTQIGSFTGGVTSRRFRITNASSNIPGIFLSGDGASIRGVDLNGCTRSCFGLDNSGSVGAAGGVYFIDDVVSTSGGNTNAVPPAAGFVPVIEITKLGGRNGGNVTVYLTHFLFASVASIADRDYSFDGVVIGRFADLAIQNIYYLGDRIFTTPFTGGYFNAFANGPATIVETDDRFFFGHGPYPPFRVYQMSPFTGSLYVARPAVADSEANCNAILGVSMHYVLVGGELVSLAQAGPCYVEFASPPTTGQMAYLRQDGGVNTGMAQDTPPTSGIVIPLGTIQAATGNFGLIDLIPSAGATVSRNGHAAGSLVGNPTGAAGVATDVSVGGGVEFSGSALRRSAFAGGDVTGPAGSAVLSIQAGAVTNAQLANMPAHTFKGNNTGSTGPAKDLTQTELTAELNLFGTAKGLVPGVASSTTQFLRADGTFAVPPGTGGGAVTSLTGDVTGTGPGATATTIAVDAVDNTKAANMANGRIKARITAGTGDPEDATGTQVTALLDVFDATHKGLVPASGGSASDFLCADGTFKTPAGTGGGGPLTGLSGDVTTTGGGVAPATIANDAVTFPKMQNIPTQTLIGRQSAGGGDPESIGVTGNIEFDGSGNIRRGALTGDVVASAGSAGTVISNGAVTNAKRANMAAGTISSNLTGGAAAPSDNTLTAVKTALAISFLDVSGTLQAAQFPALTGDVTTTAGSLATTLASTGATAGTYGDGSHSITVQVDAKGRVLAISAPSISITAGAVSGLAAIATTGSGADLSANSVSDNKLRSRGALTVMGRAANSSGNVDDIPATVDDRVLGRRASALGFFQVDNPMIASGAVGLNKHQAFPPHTMLGNDTGASTDPNYMTVAAVRTFLGLDNPQSFEFAVSWGVGDGTTADSVTLSSIVGNWPIWLRPVSKPSDYNVLGYIGGSADANLNQPEVAWELVTDADFGHCVMTAVVEKWDPQSSGSPAVTLAVSKSKTIDSSPCTLTLTGTGGYNSGVVAYAIAAGNSVGVRMLPNTAWGIGGGGSPHLKLTVKVRLTP